MEGELTSLATVSMKAPDGSVRPVVALVREDQDHLILCPGYTDLLGDRDINNNMEMVEFYSLVIARRRENGLD